MSGNIINVNLSEETFRENVENESTFEKFSEDSSKATSPRPVWKCNGGSRSVWVMVTWCLCLTALSLFTLSVFSEFIEHNPITIITFVNKPEHPGPVVVKVCPTVFLDPEKIRNYSGSEIDFKTYEFLYRAVSGVPFDDTYFVAISPMKDSFLVSSRIMEEFKLDKNQFIVNCFLVGHYDDCLPAFEWHLDPEQPCYRAEIDIRGYGRYNTVFISFIFDPTKTLGRYTSKLGAYVTFSHPHDYVAPSDGVFIGAKQSAVVSGSVFHKKQGESFEKAACVKKQSLDFFNFTGVPFWSDYQPEHCVNLCYAQSYYKRCNCSSQLGMNLTNTECIENEEKRLCVLEGVRDFKTVSKLSKQCVSGCLTKCEHSYYNLVAHKEPQLIPPEKIRHLLNLLKARKYTNSTLVQHLQQRIDGNPNQLEEAELISENLGQVTFYLRNNQQETKFEVIPFLTFPTFVSNVGGLVGMWLGVSVISITQLLEEKIVSFCTRKVSTRKVQPQ